MAVKIALNNGVRAVWMPSMWSENHAAYVRSQGHGMGYQTLGMEFPQEGKGLTILDGENKIKDEVKDIDTKSLSQQELTDVRPTILFESSDGVESVHTRKRLRLA